MSGSRQGGQLAAVTNKQRYGNDFYIHVGRKGGMASRKGGFASKVVGKDGMTGSQRAAKYGKMGGSKSRRNRV